MRARAFGQPTASSGAPLPNRRVRRVPAVTRAVAILRLLAKAETPIGVKAIARELGLIPSTCLHILRVLVSEELVAFDSDTKRYSLDAGVLTIARSLLRRNSVSQIAQPRLEQLSARFPITAVAVQVFGLEHIIVVAMARSEPALRLHVNIGSRFPALMSATGRCLAAFGGYSWSELERRFKLLHWDHPPSLKIWRAEVEAAKRNHYSVDCGNYISGVTIIAAPVMNEHGRMSHAIVAVGVSEQIEEAGVTAIASELGEIADEISHRLSDR